MILLILEAPDLRIPREFRDYLLTLKEKIPQAHLDHLRKLGLEGEHLQGWEKLMDLRYGEYAKDRHEVRAAAMEVESSGKALDLDDLSKRFKCSFRFKRWPSAATTMFAGERPGGAMTCLS